MGSREVGDLLEDCLRAAEAAAHQCIQPTEAQRLRLCSCTESLCAELASLLDEAVEMKWPFVPEKWQYKLSVSASDKTNLSDLIRKHLPQLLAVLKASIEAQEAATALALVFLVDRFLYWTDESSRLLRITKLLHRRHPDTPVAPQLVIRQARVYLNSGKLQKAEYILSSLINACGATGCWLYQCESDRALVQAVSVQVRGMILQKLGLWLEAAELIWASLVGYFSLPQPDKKGIGTSLGILANVLVSMNDEDFHTFRTNPDIELQALLGDESHRLLSAAQAAKMAVVYSQYTSLYVLTNVATQGTCLLSHSFSVECSESQRRSVLLLAKEAFAIGLLTKAEGEQVTSQQELHTFLKAAYSLTVVHKWLGAPQEALAQAALACQKALAAFYAFCQAETQDKDSLCAEIMQLVSQVKKLLRVEPFFNSDKGSFIPDSYRHIEDVAVSFTPDSFSKVMQKFKKYHASLCDIPSSHCKAPKDEVDGARLCITALGTTVGALNTSCNTEACKVSPAGEEPQQRGSSSPAVSPELCPTLESTDALGSSWDKFSLSGSGSSWPGSSGYAASCATRVGADGKNQSCVATEVSDEESDSMLQFTDGNKKQGLHGFQSAGGSHAVPQSEAPATSSSHVSSDAERFDVIQAGIETEWADVGGPPQSLSQLALRTSSSSLSDSFSSQSSWEKISADLNSPTTRKPQSSNLPKAGNGQIHESSALDPGHSDAARDLMCKEPTSGWDCKASSKQRPLESLNINPNATTEEDFESVEPATKNSAVLPHQDLSQCASTEASTESSFEMLEENHSEHQHNEVSSEEKVFIPQRKNPNPSCYSCLKHSAVGRREQQYLLSQTDYQALLAGICHDCLLERLHSDEVHFKLKEYSTVHSALHLKFSKAKGLWTARETCVYIGEPMGEQGKQRAAIWVQFLHQEERLSSYVGKDYLEPKQIQFHLKDVERQMTAQYYVTEFNKRLYDRDVMAQIFFIPSEALLILNGNEVVGCISVEPYMLGNFVKLTNNTWKKDERLQATKYGLAFGHFTYQFSDCKDIVVDLQGWVTANGKGLTYLTDPQIHSTKTPTDKGNFAARGIRYFLEEQHGPECNDICQLLHLPPVVRQPQNTNPLLNESFLINK